MEKEIQAYFFLHFTVDSSSFVKPLFPMLDSLTRRGNFLKSTPLFLMSTHHYNPYLASLLLKNLDYIKLVFNLHLFKRIFLSGDRFQLVLFSVRIQILDGIIFRLKLDCRQYYFSSGVRFRTVLFLVQWVRGENWGYSDTERGACNDIWREPAYGERD